MANPADDPKIDLPRFTRVCVQAAVRQEINAYYLIAVAFIESAIKNIPAHGSSGFGPFQILAGTWSEYMVDTGFADDDRFDPYCQPFVAAKIAVDAMKALRPVLPDGRMPTPAELYCAHLFGVQGAKIILGLGGGLNLSIRDALINVYHSSGDPDGRADKIITANKSLLAPGGNLRTVQGVLDEMARRLDEGFAQALPDNIAAQIDPALKRQLVAKTEFQGITYFVLDQFGDDEGGQILIRQAPGQQPETLSSDTTVFPISSALVPAQVANELNQAVAAVPPSPEPPKPGVVAGRSAKLLAAAQAADGHLITSTAPGTSHGRLACAWAVNHVTEDAFGQPIGGGVSTAEMCKVLRKNHAAVPQANIESGDIIISPTEGRNVGHVGIVGPLAGGNTIIYSNSSSKGKFLHTFTLAKWNSFYGGKGLEVLFFKP